MMNHNMNEVNNFYRPATFEAIMFNEPKKAMLLENYFAKQREYLKSSSIPTVNLTYGIISPRSTHIAKPGWTGVAGEYLAIKKSCETGKQASTYGKSYYSNISGCRFAYAADLPIAYLIEIMDRNKDNKSVQELYDEYYQSKVNSRINEIQLANIKDMNKSLKNQNEALKAQIDELKTSIGKLFEIASK